MNVSTAAPASALKLALHTTTANEWSEAPDYAFLEISPAEAQATLHVLYCAREFRARLAISGFADPCFDLSLGLGQKLPRFRLIPIPFVEGQEPDRDRPLVQLPENFDPDSTADEYRVECHRIESAEEGVRFSALLRHGDDRFTTTDLSETLLQMIADDHPSDLTIATLTDAQGH